MIGRLDVAVERLDPRGDGIRFLVRALGPGANDYRFEIGVTRTAALIWRSQDLSRDVQRLATTILLQRGTASAPPESGYSFDSYNSEATIDETENKIRNLGADHFLKDQSARAELSALFGKDILPALDRANTAFAAIGERSTRSLDAAFDHSRASSDLGSPPSTNPDFLYRICILSVIIDRFGVRRPEDGASPSLKALEKWAADRVGPDEARARLEAFARVKGLRKQYPIHEHYEEHSDGQRRVRREIADAERFFGFRSDMTYPGKWHLISHRFVEAIDWVASLVGDVEPPD